ncbi:Fur family transcriptional regulator [Luteococcus sanguinis]|uniref:Fur family transcriptional regulator n=1 Tax=Luteococcus sanguinis TaxID=174038 RepID=A0ABW1X4I1_9ACTN
METVPHSRSRDSHSPDSHSRDSHSHTSHAPDTHVQHLLAGVAERLREQGARMTGPRTVVLQVLAANPGHLSADQVCQRVTALDPTVHSSSVDRTLALLCQMGVVQSVAVAHGQTTYHLVAGSAHAHAQCRSCNRLVDLPIEVMDPLCATLRERTGFSVEPAGVALRGLCEQCAGRRPAT